MNIQSILPKLDLIKCESLVYYVLVLTESWLKPEVKNDNLLIDNFLPPFRVELKGATALEVELLFVIGKLTCMRHTDLELQNLEAVLIEIVNKTKKYSH